MEFHEKLQVLRRQKGLTQEELAEQLYVSRTAISKWESGRGYPSIDSLKALSKFFAVTIDEMLSGGELLTIAEEEKRRAKTHARNMAFGWLDCCAVMLLFLPFFGQEAGGGVQAVSLFALTETQMYLKAAYAGAIIAMALCGIAMLALQNGDCIFWQRNKHWLSMMINAAAAVLFIVGQQPYAAIFAFVFLMVKVWMLLKQR